MTNLAGFGPREDPLDPELVPWLVQTDYLGQCLKHPLVFDIPFMPSMAWRSNEELKRKREAVAAAREEGNWGQVMWLHERPYRRDVVLEAQEHLSPRRYWDLVRSLWIDTENLWQWTEPIIRQILLVSIPERQYIMEEDERNALASFPPLLEIYRGYVHPRGQRRGWAWTIDHDKARWFSKRLQEKSDKPRVVHGLVERSNVIAYFTGRGESEIVVDPQHVKTRKLK
jgi:hypothetical protein